jgi:hypothetical protein
MVCVHACCCTWWHSSSQRNVTCTVWQHCRFTVRGRWAPLTQMAAGACCALLQPEQLPWCTKVGHCILASNGAACGLDVGSARVRAEIMQQATLLLLPASGKWEHAPSAHALWIQACSGMYQHCFGGAAGPDGRRHGVFEVGIGGPVLLYSPYPYPFPRCCMPAAGRTIQTGRTSRTLQKPVTAVGRRASNPVSPNLYRTEVHVAGFRNDLQGHAASLFVVRELRSCILL